MPGISECPGPNAPAFNARTEARSSPNVNDPIRLSADTSASSDYASYQFKDLSQWVSANSAATICWRNDATLGNPVKIGSVFWLGPVPGQKAISVNCGDLAVCTFTVQGKNLSKLDHKVSRLAILEECGVAKGPGVAHARSENPGAPSFVMMGNSQQEEFVTEDDLKPGMLQTTSTHRVVFIY